MDAVLCAEPSQIIATCGLVLDIIGVAMLFWVGLPRTLVKNLIPENFVLEGNEHSRKHPDSIESQVLAKENRARGPRMVGLIGLGLLIVGFAMQAIALWV